MRKGMLVAAALATLALGPAAGVARADFVCPVLKISDQAYNNSKAGFITISGGDRSIIPGNSGSLDIPDRATNAEGTGSPAGAHARPGDPGYTAIWNS